MKYKKIVSHCLFAIIICATKTSLGLTLEEQINSNRLPKKCLSSNVPLKKCSANLQFLAELDSVIVSTPTKIQQEQNLLNLTLDEAIKSAVRNNAHIKVAPKQVLEAREQIKEAQASYLPDLTFTSYGSIDDEQIDTTTNRIKGIVSDELTATIAAKLQLSYYLYDGGERSEQVNIARENLKSALFEMEITILEIAKDTIEAYYQLQEASQEVELSRTSSS